MKNWDFDLQRLDRVKCPVCRRAYEAHDLNGMLTCQKIANDFVLNFIVPVKNFVRLDQFAVARKTWKAFLKAFPQYKHKDLTTREKIKHAY